MPNLKLGKKSNNMYAVHISLPRGIVEMKSYCKVNGGMLAVSKSEFDFAMAAGMDKLIAAEVVAVGESSSVAIPVAVPVVKTVGVKAAVAEVKVEDSMPVTAVQMTVEMSEPAEAVVEESVEEVTDYTEESADAPKDTAKSRRRRA